MNCRFERALPTLPAPPALAALPAPIETIQRAIVVCGVDALRGARSGRFALIRRLQGHHGEVARAQGGTGLGLVDHHIKALLQGPR